MPLLFNLRYSILRHLLVIWLIVSMLGYGLALAADVHQEVVSGETADVQQPAAPDQPALDDLDCGHCGHGIYHLLGLASRFSFLTAEFDELRGETPQPLFSSPPPQAIHRPPIAA